MTHRSWGALAAIVVVVLAATQAVGRYTGDRLGTRVAAAARAGDIAMIGSETCLYCDRARIWLSAHGVAFSECAIERAAACRDRYRALAAPGTPVFVVRGRRVVGFDPRAIAAALEADAPPVHDAAAATAGGGGATRDPVRIRS